MSNAPKRSSAIGERDFEMDQMAEAELQRLQRQKRVMENERVTFNEERMKKSRQQKKIIEILRREQEQLQEELNSILMGPHAKRESELEQEMKRLEAEIENNTQLLDTEKGNLWELDGHIRKLQKEIDRLRSNQITDQRYNEKICKMQKDVVKLENRLEVAHKRAGAVMAENAELRQMIDHMLQERALFNDVWAKMVTQLNQGKKHMMELIDQSTAAYDQRDELCNKLQLLKDRSQADKMAHIQEMRELQRKLDHDAKLHQFLGIKGQHRVNTELDMREANKKRQLQEQLENQLEEYNTILNRIRAFSTEEDIDKLASQFVKQEEENFALFNYVNELSHEVETLNESVQRLQDSIEEQRGLNESKKKSQMDTIESLEKELELQTEKADRANEIKVTCDDKLNELLTGVEKIFRLIRCDDAPVLNLLGIHKKVTINNVQLFLGIIEKKTNQMIATITYVEPPSKILAKKDRIPKFNVRESAKGHRSQQK
ncbi:coiled-coil domain-containing protein 63 [Lutzomyia longipalpis]|uniref:coiled-coil domain-containing protein 63 n=1 Tax=Lutzomyia longipalpis TaxID=7200 RepID=UPI0024833FF3|nr:coiled-coil domain-containing protein 63 [Lutzomyia longipalpis]